MFKIFLMVIGESRGVVPGYFVPAMTLSLFFLSLPDIVPQANFLTGNDLVATDSVLQV